MNYEYMIPPFRHDGFNTLNSRQIEQYFLWYIEQSAYRIDLLNKYIKSTNCDLIMDYSPDSLIELWDWYEKYVLLNDEINDKSVSIDNGTKLFSNTVLKIALDISFYFAETIIKNNPTIKWGYFTRPKNLMSVNKPVLLGFKSSCLDPRLIIENCSYRSIRCRNRNNLYNIYNNWLKFL